MKRRRRKDATISETLRQAIAESEIPLLVLEQETGVKRQSIGRFLKGERTLRLDIAESLAAYFGFELVQCERKNMSKIADIKDAQCAKVKAFLKTRPGVPCDHKEITRATGVTKFRMDRNRWLSSDRQIERTEATKKHGVRYGIRWTYIGPA